MRLLVRLRTRLALAFAAVGLGSLLLAGLVTARLVEARFDAAARRRLDEVERSAGRVIDEVRADVTDRLARAAASPRLEERLRAANREASSNAEWVDLAAQLAADVGLDLLALVDSAGRTLSSAHWPARFGYPDPTVTALADRAGAAVFTIEPTREGPVLALAAGRRVSLGRVDVVVAGGRAVGQRFVDRLAEATGAAVALVPLARSPAAPSPGPGPSGPDAGGPFVSAGAPAGLAGVEGGRLVAGGRRVDVRVLPLAGAGGAPVARLVVAFADPTLARLLRDIRGGFLVALALALAAAWLAGLVLARRLTAPLDALAASARAVAGGRLDVRVAGEERGDEIGLLVRAFNAMVADLAESRARLAAAERVAAWREMARGLAHELKNPLTPIALSLETLRKAHAARHPDFAAIFDEATATILAEVESLKRVVRDFSDFASLSRPILAPTDVNEVARAAAGLYRGAAAGVEIALDLSGRLPPAEADGELLVRALTNLIKNGIEAMPAGGRLTVSTHCVERGGAASVVIEVRDEGAGLPAAAGQLLAGGYTTKSGGSGIGLALVQRIVADQGGELLVRSVPAAGTTFAIVLRASPRSRAAPALAEPGGDGGGAGGAAG